MTRLRISVEVEIKPAVKTTTAVTISPVMTGKTVSTSMSLRSTGFRSAQIKSMEDTLEERFALTRAACVWNHPNHALDEIGRASCRERVSLTV